MSDGGSRADRNPDGGLKLTRGQLVSRRLLGTEALYRVIGENERGIEVEVVQVEGLRPGSRFTFSLKDVLAMDSVDQSEPTSRSGDSPRRPG
ncbi:MAG TPA: hypothetical protein VHW96_00765 [Solirubrobacteraceae bacterium]|jgi:hypothetical protein|nr:hypothetical protein [Solirubrobacteraceae bacterium]